MQIVRESIFVSAIRSFFNSFLAVLGVLIALILVAILVSSFSSPYQVEDDFIEMRVLPDANDNTTVLPETVPVILQVDISGVIGMDRLTGDSIEAFLRASRKGVFKNNRVKGVLLYIDSPGGTAIDSDRIYQALMRYKAAFNVPVYAYTPGFCASGGYMVACAADKIYANASSVVGSVGVVWGLGFNFWNFMQTHGIDAVTLSAGLDKQKYPTFTKAEPGSYNDLINVVKESYVQFTGLVATSRSTHGLTTDALITTYGARVYTGMTAEKNGYVDNGNAYYTEVLSDLVKTLNLDSSPYQVIQLNCKRSALKDLVSNKLSLWLDETKRALFGLKSEGRFSNTLLYYYEPQDRFNQTLCN